MADTRDLDREDRTLLDNIKETFACGEKDVTAYSPLALAYIGDDIYDVIVRTVAVERANRPANELHKEAVKYVKAEAQARTVETLLKTDFLTDEEKDIYKRGRNAKSYTKAKNASVTDYRKATGFETVLGYLYLKGRQDRVVEIVKKTMELIEGGETV
ncbi:MAG: ribonuclease III [Lachnospiraceae bacterium]|nr:ribonuclease III [Lachnospiraceae bacterium]